MNELNRKSSPPPTSRDFQQTSYDVLPHALGYFCSDLLKIALPVESQVDRLVMSLAVRGTLF